MRGLILANGLGTRMQSLIGHDKELMNVVYMGEKIPLILRTVEQFKERGIAEKDIYIFSGKHLIKTMFALSDVNIIDPGPPEFMLVDFKKTMPYWEGKCALSFGDVLWSEHGMDEMCKQERYRVPGSRVKHGGEGYGWTVFGRDVEWVTPHCDYAINYIRKYGPRPGSGGWQMLRHMLEEDPERHVLDNYIFLDLGHTDYTMDFDYPSDYDYYRKNLEPALLAEGKVETL